MRPLRIPLRAVLYKKGNDWIARCLEFDLLGDGKDQKSALQSLSKAILVQVEASIKYENMANLFTPADGKYFRMFAAGTNIASGEMHLIPEEIDSFTIEGVHAREYTATIDSNPELVLT